MTEKHVGKVTCAKVEKRSKETIYVLLVEWSDNTASYVGRTQNDLQNLKDFVNKKLKQDICQEIDLKLKERSFISLILQDRNMKILNEFFDTLLKQNQQILKDFQTKDFFTIGSSPTHKEFIHNMKTRSDHSFSFEPEIINEALYGEYSEIGPQSLALVSNQGPQNILPQNDIIPIYSKVNKPKKSLSPDSPVPDLISSPKAWDFTSQEDESNNISVEMIKMPPMPRFKPPSLNKDRDELTRKNKQVSSEVSVEAVADYESREGDTLSFERGTIGTLISQRDTDWWCVKIDSQVGWVPGDYWKMTSSSPISCGRSKSAWFVGKILREECEEMMLKYGRQGDFVVRESLNGNLAISVKHKDIIKHFPIIVTEDEKFNIGKYDFKSIENIVSYYCTNALFYDEEGKPIKLARPVVIVGDYKKIKTTQ